MRWRKVGRKGKEGKRERRDKGKTFNGEMRGSCRKEKKKVECG